MIRCFSSRYFSSRAGESRRAVVASEPIWVRLRERAMRSARTVCSPPVGPDGVDLTDLDNFTDGFPHDLFARHRAEAPVWWHEPTEHTPDGEGFWSVATYAEV